MASVLLLNAVNWLAGGELSNRANTTGAQLKPDPQSSLWFLDGDSQRRKINQTAVLEVPGLYLLTRPGESAKFLPVNAYHPDESSNVLNRSIGLQSVRRPGERGKRTRSSLAADSRRRRSSPWR